MHIKSTLGPFAKFHATFLMKLVDKSSLFLTQTELILAPQKAQLAKFLFCPLWFLTARRIANDSLSCLTLSSYLGESHDNLLRFSTGTNQTL